MQTALKLGIVWALPLYVGGAFMLKRAEAKLSLEALATLKTHRRLKVLPFLFAGSVLLSVYMRPNASWFVLSVGSVLALVMLLIDLRQSPLPQSYLRSYRIAASLISLGWVGLGLSFGAINGFSL